MPAYGFASFHTFLILLAGVFIAGFVIHLFRARTSEQPRVHGYLATLCLLSTAYLLLQDCEYSCDDIATTALLRRGQAGVASLFLVVYPWFLVLVTRLSDRLVPACISALGLLLLAQGIRSPTGLWLSSIDSIAQERLPWGELLHQAHGTLSPWVMVTLGIWCLLTGYGIVCALRYRRRPGAVGAKALIVFHAFFFLAVINDMLMDAGRISSIPLGILCSPILVGGLWWRTAVEEARRAVALRELFQRSAEANLVQDAGSGQIHEVNAAACRILARERGELEGSQLVEVLSEADRPRLRELLARSRAGQDAEAGVDAGIIEVLCLRPNGESFPAQISLRSTILESRPCIVASLRDVTELKRAEAEKSQLELQMLHAQRLESLGILAGGIAHDFNNILTAILGRINLAAMALPGGPAREHLLEADIAVRRAAELCQQMLVYAGKGKPQVSALDLSGVVEEMGRMLEVTVSANIQLQRDLAKDLPAIRGDANQLRQVVMNLITNAADAIGRNQGRILLRTRLMGVSTLPSEHFVAGPPDAASCVVIEVVDSGCGMDAETRRRMFDPFFTTKFTGRGLGMSAVLGIVRDHAGAISVDSALGRGTTVAIYLPAQDQASVPPSQAPAPAPAQAGDFCVLLVDDDAAVRVLTASMIEHLGYQVVQAESGEKALQLFARERQRIRLALVDATMPDMDGISVISALLDQERELPVILSSGFSQADTTSWVQAHEHVRFLEKPYDLRTLAAAITQSRNAGPIAGGRR